jgi:glyoxylase-like metal-dependent hydrolase (beta-lactamase superfamily II)
MADDLRLYMLDCGTLRCKKQSIFLDEGIGEDYEIPVPWYVIVHPSGTLVVDGGNPPEVVDDPVGHWGEVAHDFWPVMTHDDVCTRQLERLGIEPASVTHILQSHLHIDHTGAVACIDEFPNARVVATRAEYEWAHEHADDPRTGNVRADFERADESRWQLLETGDDGHDLFADGAIRCWHSPGHSAGHMSLEVTLPRDGALLLAVDAAYTMEHWHSRALPGSMVSRSDTQRSVEKLRGIAASSSARPGPGHDPVAWATFTKAPDFYC